MESGFKDFAGATGFLVPFISQIMCWWVSISIDKKKETRQTEEEIWRKNSSMRFIYIQDKRILSQYLIFCWDKVE